MSEQNVFAWTCQIIMSDCKILLWALYQPSVAKTMILTNMINDDIPAGSVIDVQLRQYGGMCTTRYLKQKTHSHDS